MAAFHIILFGLKYMNNNSDKNSSYFFVIFNSQVLKFCYSV